MLVLLYVAGTLSVIYQLCCVRAQCNLSNAMLESCRGSDGRARTLPNICCITFGVWYVVFYRVGDLEFAATLPLLAISLKLSICCSVCLYLLYYIVVQDPSFSVLE